TTISRTLLPPSRLCTAPAPTALHTLSLHDALPISSRNNAAARLEHVLQTGEDVGSHTLASSPASTPAPRPSAPGAPDVVDEPERSEEHTSELQSRFDLVCRLLLEKQKTPQPRNHAR